MTDPMAIDCDAVRELAGLYALGALEPAEAAAVREHLATCDDAHAELLEHGEVAGSLLLDARARGAAGRPEGPPAWRPPRRTCARAGTRRPPAGLRDAPASDVATAAPGPAPAAAAGRSASSSPASAAGSGSASLAAAAAVIVAVVFGGYAALLTTSSRRPSLPPAGRGGRSSSPAARQRDRRHRRRRPGRVRAWASSARTGPWSSRCAASPDARDPGLHGVGDRRGRRRPSRSATSTSGTDGTGIAIGISP